MADVKEIYSHLDSLFPRSLSCSWDNDGLMVCPDSSGKVKKVLLALDVTQKVANEAICGGYDVIISHHPLIFRPLRQLSEEFAGAAVPMKLFSAGISVISLHTRFDAGEGGINDTLASLGLSDAFDSSKADLSKIGKCSDGNNLYINEVLHKTHIEVGERGTKAGAVTSVAINKETAIEFDKVQIVTLDRPFVYMIFDNETSMPIFIGAVADIQQ